MRAESARVWSHLWEYGGEELLLLISLNILSYTLIIIIMTKTTGLKRFLPKRFQKKNGQAFVPKKKLCQRDMIIVDMLNRDVISFCITDPEQEDNPVIYISEVSKKKL